MPVNKIFFNIYTDIFFENEYLIFALVQLKELIFMRKIIIFLLCKIDVYSLRKFMFPRNSHRPL